jgi:hypothetical protein
LLTEIEEIPKIEEDITSYGARLISLFAPVLLVDHFGPDREYALGAARKDRG